MVLDAAIREVLRETFRAEIRAALRDELPAALGAAGLADSGTAHPAGSPVHEVPSGPVEIPTTPHRLAISDAGGFWNAGIRRDGEHAPADGHRPLGLSGCCSGDRFGN